MVVVPGIKHAEDAGGDTIKSRKLKLSVRIQSIRFLADSILAFELVDPGGANLPAFTAGSHVDVYLPNGLIRQYSLCNDPAETFRYVIAVQRDSASRGGSSALHDDIRPGQMITISRPRNQFTLDETASEYLLLAGGIGVTPIMSMVAVLSRLKQPFHLYYCTRTPSRTAFLPEVNELVEKGNATLIHDHGKPSDGLSLNSILGEYRNGQQLYYCGPAGFLEAVEAASRNWPDAARKCERFTAPVAPRTEHRERDAGFYIRLAKTGKQFFVPPEKTIVDILREHGFDIETSCEEGYCGTCMTRYLEGDPIHRDSVLDDEDRSEFMMICCARAESRDECLVLDL